MFELTEEYTAYPLEDEVLVQDGLEYQILSNTLEKMEGTNTSYHLIKLKYPVWLSDDLLTLLIIIINKLNI